MATRLEVDGRAGISRVESRVILSTERDVVQALGRLSAVRPREHAPTSW